MIEVPLFEKNWKQHNWLKYVQLLEKWDTQKPRYKNKDITTTSLLWIFW